MRMGDMANPSHNWFNITTKSDRLHTFTFTVSVLFFRASSLRGCSFQGNPLLELTCHQIATLYTFHRNARGR